MNPPRADILEFERDAKRLIRDIDVDALLICWRVLPNVLARGGILSSSLLRRLLSEVLLAEDSGRLDLHFLVGLVARGGQILDSADERLVRADFTENDVLAIEMRRRDPASERELSRLHAVPKQ